MNKLLGIKKSFFLFNVIVIIKLDSRKGDKKMSFIVINYVWNDCEDGPYRTKLIIGNNQFENGVALNPKENVIIFYQDEEVLKKSFVKVKEKDDNVQIESYVETIHINGLKIFDCADYDIKTYTIDGEKKYALEDRKAIKIPVIL